MWLSIYFILYLILIWGLNTNFWVNCILTISVIPLALMLYQYCEEIHKEVFNEDINKIKIAANKKVLAQEQLIEDYKKIIENYEKEMILLQKVASSVKYSNNS